MIDFGNYSLGKEISKLHEMYTYEPTNKKTGEKCVMKVFNSNLVSPRGYDRLALEIELFTNSNHPYMEKIIGFSTKTPQSNTGITYLHEKKSMKNLYEEIHVKKSEITATVKTNIIYAISHVLKSLHATGAAFPLLDSHGIIFDDDHVYISFRSVEPNDSKFGIFPWYSPEKYQDKFVSPANDIYAFGVILFELVFGRFPFEDSADRNDYARRVKRNEETELTEAEEADESKTKFFELFTKCTSKDAKDRPTAEALFETIKSLHFDGCDDKKFEEFTKTGDVDINFDVDYKKHFKVYADKGDSMMCFLLGSLTLEDSAESALEYLNKAAEHHFAPAQYLLSMYYEGEQPATSIRLLTDAAKANYITAVAKIGVVALTNRNYTEAVQLFKKAADAGDLLGITNYGRMVLVGAGCKADPEEGMKYLMKGAKLGDPNCQFLAASVLIERGETDEGWRMMVLAGAQGNMRAQSAVAFDLADRTSPNYNPPAAVEVFKDLIHAGSTDAMTRMAQILMTGEGGVEKDEAKAAGYFRQAMERGMPAAAVEYAQCLIDGRGVGKDVEEGERLMKTWALERKYPEAMLRWSEKIRSEDEKAADELLQAAAEKGHPEAAYRAAMRAKEPTDKFILLRKAADGGHAEALHEMAVMMREHDPKKSRLVNENAARAGSAIAQLEVGIEMLGESENKENGVALIKKAAEAGLPAAVFELGKMLLEGEHVEKNEADGAKLVGAAANDNVKEAMALLADLLENGRGVDKDEAAAADWRKRSQE